ncbi:MAG: orotate phosphoribosyltransferase [Prevotellaceae bacterium]|jgi:orotate phosphoribosyltransferase|nr:orotate phosphoribosyltransferase [Prevotellaceae bacterium]
MEKTAKRIATDLLQIKAIKLDSANYFTWASGWHSPIYCDNRKTLSYPDVRKTIYKSFASLITDKFSDVDVIAGVATGAIAHGVLVAEKLGKPFVYVRSAPKAHGLENLIEGDLQEGARVVVVEDLISTGGSSIAAVNALRKAGSEVLGMVAIFTYGFDIARKQMEDNDCLLYTLSDYTTLIEEAIEQGYVKAEELETLKEWRESPSTWKK